MQHQQREQRPYDPTAYAEYMQLPPLNDNQPLTSATYIPGGESFGPGVGIPPLHSHSSMSQLNPNSYIRPGLPQQQPSYYRGASNEFTTGPDLGSHTQMRYGGDTTYNAQHDHHNWLSNAQYQYQQQQPPVQPVPTPPQSSNNYPPLTPTSRQKTLILPAKETQEHPPPTPATQTQNTPFSQPTTSKADERSTQGNRDHSSSGDTPASPGQDHNWPAERVQIWLAAHNFSKEWQAAFRHLNLHGATFLDIGRSGKQQNFGLLPNTVLPQIARECTTNGGVWDQAREREESRRIRRLVRDIIRNGGAAETPSTAATSSSTSLPLAIRRQSSQYPQSAGTDAESSPNINREPFGSTPTTAHSADGESPGRAMPPPHTIAQRRFSGQRAVTLDVMSRSLDDNGRSGFSASALGSIADIPRRHSPSASSEFGAGRGNRNFSSPQQSPGLSGSMPPPNNSNLANNRYYHGRNISSDTNVPTQSKLPPEDTKRRNATDGSRPPGSDRHGSHETPISAAVKEHSKGFLDKFRRNKNKKDDPSPTTEEDGFPPSPQATRHHAAMYGKSQAALSDVSLERPPSRKSAGHQSVESVDSLPPLPVDRGRGRAREGDKKFVFVTPDGWNYRLIDITDVETAEQLRTVICYNLGVPEGPDVTIHMTSPGQVEHEEALNDQLLVNARFRMADPTGSLKLFVRSPAGMMGSIPESAGLGLRTGGVGGFPQSPFGKASFADKPLDETTLARLNGELESPTTVRSGESTLVADRATLLQRLQKEGDTNGMTMNEINAKLQETMLQQDFQNLPEHERIALLEAKQKEHKKETDRKQQAYLEHRRSKLSEDASSRRLVDFDNPRASPFADGRPTSSGSIEGTGSMGSLERKMVEGLVPMRKPPPVPEPTSTLVKANSLTKKGPNARTSWPNRKEEPWKRISSGSIPEEEGKRPNSRAGGTAPSGIGAALAGAGHSAGAIGMGSGSSSAPTSSSGLQKSMTAPDLGQEGKAQRALTGVDFEKAAAGRQSPGAPKSPFTLSKGGQQFKVPTYEEDNEDGEEDEDTLKASQHNTRPNLSLQMPSNPSLNKIRDVGPGRRSPDLSPSSTHPPGGGLQRMQSKRGPSFDVPDRPVDFAPSPAMVREESEDEDSDDGLFAIPLRGGATTNTSASTPKAPQSAKTPATAGSSAQGLGIGDKNSPASRSPSRPSLRLKTSRGNVRFDSPKAPPIDKHTFPATDELEESDAIPSATSNPMTDSSDDFNRFGRRESFASDMWANRPPAEGIVEHLDDFFPNVDLDQPMVDPAEEGAGTDGSPSTATTEKSSGLSTKASSSDLHQQQQGGSSRSVTPLSSADESDTMGSEVNLRRGDVGLTSVAQRNMRKSGGLGRTKSIRDVVKNNYSMQAQHGHHPSTSSFVSSRAPSESGPSGAAAALSGLPGALPLVGSGASNNLSNRISTLRQDAAGGIVRRKSTKMFGARIEQVKPARGSRLINNLETIPQDTIPMGNVQHMKSSQPERQPTFKWMRGQLIGKGTFGRVYLGMNTTTGELLAVKQVEVNPKNPNVDPAKIREMVKALDIEIDTMQHLDHVNIVQYLGCERKEFSISIFLEYIPGGSIGSCLRKHGKFEEQVVSSLTRQTLNGLAYLHSEGILHRDLKADNILLDLDGTCKISDFGISKRSADAYANDNSNSMQGSVFWMAPEVIRAQSQGLAPPPSNLGGNPYSNENPGYSAKVDIWSLGCVVLEMFAGRRPWSKEEAIGAIYKLGSLNQAPPIPDDVSSVVGPAALSFMYDCFTM
jgi:mitogen-activated protein kinase kinase kinase